MLALARKRINSGRLWERLVTSPVTDLPDKNGYTPQHEDVIDFVLRGLLPLKATAQKVNLPCASPRITVAGDGSGVWVVCARNWSAIKKAPDAALPPPGRYENPTDVYWIDATRMVPEKIADADTDIAVVAAPTGSQSVFVVPQRSGASKVLLYNRKEEMRELPIDPSFLLWAGDAQRLYFYGGTTIRADAWNILGIYDLTNGTIRRAKLREPTEILRVCPASGEVYSATPEYPNFSGSTVEYTPDIRFVRRIHEWIGAEFSAQCTYVASESDYHGPLSWSIYDTRTGKKLFRFSAYDDNAQGEMYSLMAWNPKHDSVLLREHISKQHERQLEVFDVESGRVLQTLPGADVQTWSADGANIIAGDGNVLTWHPVNF